MKTKMILIFTLLQILTSTITSAHPGSGIVVDKYGQVYFTDTGKVYVLEWHDVTPENLEVRIAYIPRVRKIGQDGKVATLATVSRN